MTRKLFFLLVRFSGSVCGIDIRDERHRITPGWPLRFLLLGINIISAVVGFGFFWSYSKSLSLGKTVKWIALGYIFMNLLAVIFNVAGRLTLAKILTSSAIVGLTQIIGLFVLVPMLTEAFYLQMKSRRLTGGMMISFDYTSIQQGLYGLFSAGAVFLWLITLATNLEIYNPIRSFLDGFLNTPRAVGKRFFFQLATSSLFIFGVVSRQCFAKIY